MSNVRRCVAFASVVLGLCTLVAPARGGVIVEDFNSASLSPYFSLNVGGGQSFAISGGRGVFSKPSGVGNSFSSLDTNFSAEGDFTATVEADRSRLGFAEMGLAVHFPTVGGDIFFVANIAVNANIEAGPVITGSVPTTASTATFRIRRTGGSVYFEFDSGLGFQVVNSTSDPRNLGSATFSVFLIQEFGSTNANIASFDNFRVEADRLVTPVPEPSTFILGGTCGLAGLVALARRGPRTAE